jgi:hypothetical protein
MSSSKLSNKRTFTINKAYHVDGCPTKFSHKDYSGRYTSRSAAGATLKALNQLCTVKSIKGRCTLYLQMRETTQGSKHKLYSYHAKRIKYDKPVIVAGIPREYHSKVKSVKIPTEKCPGSHKSSGRMRSRKSSSKKHSRSSSRSHSRSRSHSKTKKSSKH